MSISRQNLSVVIVTIKSENVIHDCIRSIDKNIPIIVVENSDNKNFKYDLEKKYDNLKCILSKFNHGTGTGYNIGIKAAATDYVLVLNADVILENNAIEELIYFCPEFLVSLANNSFPGGDIFENADTYFAIKLESREVPIKPLIPEILLIKVILAA